MDTDTGIPIGRYTDTRVGQHSWARNWCSFNNGQVIRATDEQTPWIWWYCSWPQAEPAQVQGWANTHPAPHTHLLLSSIWAGKPRWISAARDENYHWLNLLGELYTTFLMVSCSTQRNSIAVIKSVQLPKPQGCLTCLQLPISITICFLFL